MSMFVCDECGVFENTALAGYRGYHGRNMELTPEEQIERPEWVARGLGDGKARCSECNPEVGRWHGHWDKEQFDPLSAGDHLRAINR